MVIYFNPWEHESYCSARAIQLKVKNERLSSIVRVPVPLLQWSTQLHSCDVALSSFYVRLQTLHSSLPMLVQVKSCQYESILHATFIMTDSLATEIESAGEETRSSNASCLTL